MYLVRKLITAKYSLFLTRMKTSYKTSSYKNGRRLVRKLIAAIYCLFLTRMKTSYKTSSYKNGRRLVRLYDLDGQVFVVYVT